MTGRLKIFLAVLICLVALIGCGSDNSSLIVSSTPENGAEKVILGHEPMQITVAKDLDPSTVNGATVTLRGQDNLTGRTIIVSGPVRQS